MSYGHYLGRVEFDAEEWIFGRIAAIKDVVGFHGGSVAGLERAFHEAVDDDLATCAKAGKQPDKVFSGRDVSG